MGAGGSMIGYAETVHGPIGLRQPGAMSGATVPASSPPVTGRHRAHARGTPASWCPPPNDRGRALTRISAKLVARGCKGIYVPACAVKYPTLLLRPLSRSSSGLCVGGLPARGWWCGVCPSPRWILTPRRYSPKCLEGSFSEVRYLQMTSRGTKELAEWYIHTPPPSVYAQSVT